jgi:LuxR family maltose regulon positive regulatory protein
MSGEARHTVERAALLRRLEAARGTGVTLIEGGAGWGKSELLRQWATLLEANSVPVVRIDHHARNTFARLNALRLGPPTPNLVVIDDCNTFDSERRRRLIAATLRDPPPLAHIAIASRERMDAVILGDQWLDRRLLRLGQADLQMSAEEAQELFEQSLSAEQLLAVVAWSEGWPALLGYVHERLATGMDLDAILETAARHDGDISRYIGEQILSPLPQRERELLTRTAFLPAFDSDLARAVTGNAQPWEVLTSLEQRLLITARADAGNPKSIDYRCHGLIREVLRHELARRGRHEYRRLHRIAARSLHSAEDAAGAVRCACNGGEFSFAAHVILCSGGMLYGVQHGTDALRSLLELMPADVVRRHPRLMIAEAYVLINEGFFDIAREIIGTVRRSLDSGQLQDDPKRAGALRRDLAIVEIILATYTSLGSVEEKIALLEKSIEAANPGELLSLGTFHNLLAWMHFRRAHLDVAATKARCALHYYSRGRAPNGSAYTHLLLGLIDIEQGRPEAATQHYECARNLFITADRCSDARGRELADVLLAEAFYEQGRLSEARALCEPAFGRICAASYSLFAVAYRTFGSLTACERGMQAAAAIFDQGVALARKRGFAALERVLELYRREVALLSGEVLPVEDASEDDSHDAGDWREHDTRLFLQARLAMRAQKTEVIGLLERMIAKFERQDRVRSQIDALVLLALAQLQIGKRAESLRTVGSAVRLGAPRCVQRPFLEHARTLAPLLLQIREHSKNDRDISFIHRVLAIGTTTAAASAISFSQRELEVLRLLAYERENKSIARELHISPETVRFHLKNVYEKLGVKDRMLVAQIARERGIIG